MSRRVKEKVGGAKGTMHFFYALVLPQFSTH